MIVQGKNEYWEEGYVLEYTINFSYPPGPTDRPPVCVIFFNMHSRMLHLHSAPNPGG